MKWQFLYKVILLGCIVSYGGQSTFAISKMETFIGEQLLEMSPKTIKKGQMILSDSPEIVMDYGILYKEEVHGEGRLLFHHLNGTQGSKRLVVMIHNAQPIAMRLNLHQRAAVGPSKHILFAGKKLLEDYFQSQNQEALVISPLKEVVIYDSKGMAWQPQEVLTGIMDYYLEGRGELIIACIKEEDSLEVIKTLKYLPRDGHPRGTFHILEESYAVHLPSFGKYYICMEQEEDWAIGKDGITQEITMNKGNYGIMYQIIIHVEADTNIYIVPRAGVFKGVVQWEDGTLCEIARNHYFKQYKEPVCVGIVHKGNTKTLRYMLPNGSAAPVWLQFEVVDNNK